MPGSGSHCARSESCRLRRAFSRCGFRFRHRLRAGLHQHRRCSRLSLGGDFLVALLLSTFSGSSQSFSWRREKPHDYSTSTARSPPGHQEGHVRRSPTPLAVPGLDAHYCLNFHAKPNTFQIMRTVKRTITVLGALVAHPPRRMG